MTQTQQLAAQRRSVLSPVVTASFGFVVYALSAMGGDVFQVNLDSRAGHTHTIRESATGMAAEFAIGLVGVAIAVWAGRRAWTGEPSHLTSTALVLALVAALAFPAFWAGWSSVFGAVAVGLALEQRRRVGSFGVGAAVALILGSAAFAAGSVTCLLG
jgi:NhaP-type Na+/H+ or K+/H+ antiporter